MPIRGAKNPFPKVLPATNSGILSGKGRQKLDPPPKLASGVAKAVREAMRSDRRKKP